MLYAFFVVNHGGNVEWCSDSSNFDLPGERSAAVNYLLLFAALPRAVPYATTHTRQLAEVWFADKSKLVFDLICLIVKVVTSTLVSLPGYVRQFSSFSLFIRSICIRSSIS